MASAYGVFTDTTFCENLADAQITSTFDTTAREQMISQAERWAAAYTGVTPSSASGNVIVAAVMEKALYNAKMRLSQDGAPVDTDAVYGTDASIETQSGAYERQAAMHEKQAQELIKLYGCEINSRIAKVNWD